MATITSECKKSKKLNCTNIESSPHLLKCTECVDVLFINDLPHWCTSSCWGSTLPAARSYYDSPFAKICITFHYDIFDRYYFFTTFLILKLLVGNLQNSPRRERPCSKLKHYKICCVLSCSTTLWRCVGGAVASIPATTRSSVSNRLHQLRWYWVPLWCELT